MKGDPTNDRFLKACRREPVDATPVWFMRQAGRYMKAFRDIRAKHSLLTVCKTPELAAEVTMQPIERFNFDAAIIFADILLPLEPMGLNLEFVKGEGPVIYNPIRDKAGVEALRPVTPEEDLGYVMEALRTVRKELKVPLIGFAGAPFTLASYMIEGSSSRNYLLAKTMMYSEPDLWDVLMKKLTRVLIDYLSAQVAAGAQVLQIFDSWIGALSPEDYRHSVFPHMRQLFSELKKLEVPLIHFGTGTSMLLELQKEAGGDVIGLDWRINLDEGWRRLGNDVAVQGNLDPVLLFSPIPEIEKRVDDILRRAGNRPGHIFNLGHGILPETPIEHVEAVIEMVHEKSAKILSSGT
ncbi:MAG TPA: uroporphyrinogen decarboxylase [Nitrospiria bacterium]|nr:uroporphyrinogen decarboxylase [Candidatus Manganitrophaceae bacterium]HIL35047.1 uroporphyrinogen decarboxylase [Candidatus Manganitrophaceae bacterium]